MIRGWDGRLLGYFEGKPKLCGDSSDIPLDKSPPPKAFLASPLLAFLKQQVSQ
jgi:hypothetical protein